jgi:hypothetical protein
MPYDVAARLFDQTRLGMRVIVAPTDVAPVEIAHPALFPAKPGAGAIAAARAAETAEAASKADQAKLAAATAARDAAREATRAMMPVRAAEKLKLGAEAQLAAAERGVASAVSAERKEQAEDAKAKAVARVAEVEVQVAAAKAELQSKLDAAASGREATAEAEKRRVVAAEAARAAARDLEPVSVFISRKTQRLYVRQAFQPILESPVTIQDADRHIGTHIFTATERTGDVDLRWNVVSLDSGHQDDGVAEPRAPARGRSGRDDEPVSTNPVGAKAALDRIVIPQEVLDRIAGIVSPRSSLIISDEALSSETAKGTEFVVLMSGEPQGGIKFRRRGLDEARYQRPRDQRLYWRSPFAGPFSTW